MNTTNENKIHSYKNGNLEVKLFNDGTRIITCKDEELKPSFPLNIDIRLSNRCSLGKSPTTGKSFCGFCHEEATQDGKRGDYNILKESLLGLPRGVELAIGANEITEDLVEFLSWSKGRGFVCNLTINQMHIKRDRETIDSLISKSLIYGLGISIRDAKTLDLLPKSIIDYPHTVFHVIAGIDNLNDILTIKSKKILILGYKTFGRGVGFKSIFKDEIEKNIAYWRSNFPRLLKTSHIVSFDNLALEQLEVKDWLTEEDFDKFYQREFSMYINSVDKTFSPSSRSSDKVDILEGEQVLTVSEYFSNLNNFN